MADDHQFLACLPSSPSTFPPNTKLNHIKVKFNEIKQILGGSVLVQTVLIGIVAKKVEECFGGRVWWWVLGGGGGGTVTCPLSQLACVIASTVKPYVSLCWCAQIFVRGGIWGAHLVWLCVVGARSIRCPPLEPTLATTKKKNSFVQLTAGLKPPKSDHLINYVQAQCERL